MYLNSTFIALLLLNAFYLSLSLSFSVLMGGCGCSLTITDIASVALCAF